MALSPLDADPLLASELEIKNILVVDDNVEVANMLKVLLESRDFVVTVVEDGLSALKEVMDLNYDVILCDIEMPKMPGDMLYLAVQKLKPELAKRFIFVTGHGDNPRVEEFLKKVDGLVVFKPVRRDDLIRMVSLVLTRVQKEQGQAA
ncbi:MAG: response regulator [Chthoniobacteraceae bacterium]